MYVCLEEQCKDNSVACVACIEEFHKNHQHRPMKFYFTELLEMEGEPLTKELMVINYYKN